MRRAGRCARPPRARRPRARAASVALLRGEREHAAAVVGVGVRVEQPRAGANAAPIAAMASPSRPSLTLGTAIRSIGCHDYYSKRKAP